MVQLEARNNSGILPNSQQDYGKTMRFYRKKVMGWKNAHIFMELYNDLVGDGETISVRWVQRVEKENNVPVDLKRRWIIATLLSIPPASFGLQPLPAAVTQYMHVPLLQPAVPAQLDRQVALARVKSLWSSWAIIYALDPIALMREMTSTIASIEHAYIYGVEHHSPTLARLLCHYLLLFGNILRDQGYLNSAFAPLEKAIALATHHELRDELAKALYLRGYVSFDLWGIQRDQREPHDLQCATQDFASALHLLEKQVGALRATVMPVYAAVLAELGLAQAYQAQDRDDRNQAFRLLDRSARLVDTNEFQRDWFFLQVNTEWVRIDKAEARLAVHWAKAALQDLDDHRKAMSPLRRRHIYTDIIEARAHLMQGHLDVAVAYAEHALDAVKQVQSLTLLRSICNLHDEMKQHDVYKTSPEVARLGVMLLQVQHPDIFS